MKGYKSDKARAWALAASYIEDDALADSGYDAVLSDARQHAINVVVPALRRKAEIIERNARRKT
jgi:hypothetical protein